MSQRSSVAASKVLSVPFIVCVLILSAAAVGKEALVRWAGVAMRKEPIPLRKWLAALDKARLGDYRVVETGQMSAAVEEALGTAEYLDWGLEDTSIKSRIDPRRAPHVLVTYYTGTQDPVPHTAEVCYFGAGYAQKQAHDNRTIEVPALGSSRSGGTIPVRVCTFIKTAIHNREEPTVVYTFHANGQFAAQRDVVRLIMANPLHKHAYFSKVEVSFGGPSSHPHNLGREESVAAAAKLFNVILPILVEDHWPDWEAIERSETQPAASSGT